MQNSKLYVGNLNYSIDNKKLEELFTTYGEVKHVNIIEGKGFGFVEMDNQANAEKAKKALNGTNFENRTLRVDIARPSKGRQRGPFRRH